MCCIITWTAVKMCLGEKNKLFYPKVHDDFCSPGEKENSMTKENHFKHVLRLNYVKIINAELMEIGQIGSQFDSNY